jgi:hypothetical protein
VGATKITIVSVEINLDSLSLLDFEILDWEIGK